MMNGEKSCYLAGPMRGYPRYNFDAFEAAEQDLQSRGYKIVSPHRMDLDVGFDPNGGLEHFDLSECVRRDANAIIDTECVIFLEGWERSKGARAEKTIAEWLGRPCYTYPSLESLAVPENVLEEANRLVHGDRGTSYGPPHKDFARTALIWEAILGIPIKPEQVALCMIGVKMSREINHHKRDNITDIAGYAATLEMTHEALYPL